MKVHTLDLLNMFLGCVMDGDIYGQLDMLYYARMNNITYGKKQNTLLHMGLMEVNKPDALKTMITNIFKADAFDLLAKQNVDGETPLHSCIENVTPEKSPVVTDTIVYLLEHPNPEVRQLPFIEDNNGKSVLEYAFESQNIKIQDKERILNVLQEKNLIDNETLANFDQQISLQNVEVANSSQRKRNFNDGNSSSFQGVSPITMPSAKRSRNMGNSERFF